MDLLRQPVIGPLLRWPHARRAAQVVLFVLAAAVVLHGLTGPQVGPRNLATVLTAIHWRGLLVIAALAAGNLFCAACPMMLARDAARRVVAPRWRWPRVLRGKWLGVVLLAGVLFAYELFDLWELPRATAWLVLGYFGLALLVDLIFRGASFCKHVCPVGQFNFTAATMAPLELQVRDRAACGSCRTSDCIKGRYADAQPAVLLRRGCELGLFLPAKTGNLDCTFCLDCVQACRHDNVALVTRVPGIEWLAPGRRSGVGRLAQRADLAALAAVFTFAAVMSAFAMTAPAHLLERQAGALLGTTNATVSLAAVFVAGLVALPLLLVGAATAAARRLAATREPLRAAAIPYVQALVPLGFGVWIAHYGFHLLTGILTVVPVTQSAVIDLAGRAALGGPAWAWIGAPSGAVFPLQLGSVLLGALGSMGLVRATAERDHPARAGAVSVPWLLLVATVAAGALWVLAQPMDMRGVTASG